MSVRSAVLVMAAWSLASIAGAQDTVSPPSATPVRGGVFRLDPGGVLSDTVRFNTNLSGNYTYGRNDNAHLRWDNGLVIRAHQRVVTALRSEYLVGVVSNDAGRRYMDRRRWKVTANADLDPAARVSPFVLASVESSIELRYVRRTSAGVGAKVTLYRWAPESSGRSDLAALLPAGNNRLDASLAVLAEQNILPVDDTLPRTDESLPRQLARLSWRFRWTHRLSDRVTLDHTTWFKPELLALHRYNAELFTRLSYVLTRRTSLTLASQHVYEGSASSRGARNNRTGTVDVGVNVNLGKKPL